MPDAYYFEQIETAWQRHQPRYLILSPVDWGFIDAWNEAGIPLTAVLLGIERTFENFRPQWPGNRPRTLRYCWPEILKAWRELADVERETGPAAPRIGLKIPRPPHRGKKYL